eukprot:TRINITY_DN1731_c0_g1_i1.p1 TRINITY_DN1731_c0_g1~~TRINITY_DN1731_c0_g1_i1.p1  ORF type:complete len:168 (+),score=11.74 TRINITY_DN1731_c0_g1_i1:44-547(+)
MALAAALTEPGVFSWGGRTIELATDLDSRVFDLFCFGTWNDYESRREAIGPLSSSLALKLQHLTLISLCSDRAFVRYGDLHRALPCFGGDDVALEDVIIGAVASGALSVRIDQIARTVAVLDTAPRDCPSARIPALSRFYANRAARAMAAATDTARLLHPEESASGA